MRSPFKNLGKQNKVVSQFTIKNYNFLIKISALKKFQNDFFSLLGQITMQFVILNKNGRNTGNAEGEGRRTSTRSIQGAQGKKR